MNPVDICVRVFDDLVSGDVRRSVSAMLAGLVIPAGSNRVPIDIDELMKTGFVDAITSVLDGPNIVTDLFLTPSARRPSIHYHDDIAVAYYANDVWLPEWLSGTMFFDDERRRALCTVAYKPGRVVVIPKNRIHSIIPPCHDMQEHRMSITVLFRKVSYANHSS